LGEGERKGEGEGKGGGGVEDGGGGTDEWYLSLNEREPLDRRGRMHEHGVYFSLPPSLPLSLSPSLPPSRSLALPACLSLHYPPSPPSLPPSPSLHHSLRPSLSLSLSRCISRTCNPFGTNPSRRGPLPLPPSLPSAQVVPLDLLWLTRPSLVLPDTEHGNDDVAVPDPVALDGGAGGGGGLGGAQSWSGDDGGNNGAVYAGGADRDSWMSGEEEWEEEGAEAGRAGPSGDSCDLGVGDEMILEMQDGSVRKLKVSGMPVSSRSFLTSLVGLFCLYRSVLILVHTSDIPEPPSLLGNSPAPLMRKPSDRAGEAACGDQGKGDGGKGGGKGTEGAGRGTQVFVNALGTACGSLWGTGAEGQGGDNWANEGESFRSTMYLHEQRRLHQDSVLVRQFLDLFDELGYVCVCSFLSQDFAKASLVLL
jgi:hypothetical protein